MSFTSHVLCVYLKLMKHSGVQTITVSCKNVHLYVWNMFPSFHHYHHHHPSQIRHHVSLDFCNSFLVVLCKTVVSIYAVPVLRNTFLFYLVELDSLFLSQLKVMFCSPNLMKCLYCKVFCYLPLLQYTCPLPTYFVHVIQGL